MKVTPCKSGDDIIYYLSKGIRKNGKCTTKHIETIGRHSELIKEHSDPLKYCKEYAKQRTLTEKEPIMYECIPFERNEDTEISDKINYNVGYFYLKKILDDLNLRKFFREKRQGKKIEFHPLLVTQFLTYARILDPKSKNGSYDDASTYFNLEHFELQDIYKTLDIISENLNDFQTHLYNESEKLIKRNTKVLYYDCTNFFFDINKESELKRYGISKENRPNPIVQLGLFIDANGIPLAFNVTPGNRNEQTTAIPLESRIIEDFNITDFVYVADAGLGSNEIRLFNTFNDRDFLVTQSLKKLKKEDLDVILDENHWYCPETGKYDIRLSDILEDDEKTYFKMMRINMPVDLGLRELTKTNRTKKRSDFYQTLIVSFNKQTQLYQRGIRAKQIERAMENIKHNCMEKTTENSPKRFIAAGENNSYYFNNDRVLYEQQFDGFYGMVTSLEEDMPLIATVMKRRWQIEELFRIMKTSLKARPVYHQKDDRIMAHFGICFLALLAFRILEKKLDNKYTIDKIIKQLKLMTVTEFAPTKYATNYKGSRLLQDLDNAFEKNMNLNIYTFNQLNRLKGNTLIK